MIKKIPRIILYLVLLASILGINPSQGGALNSNISIITALNPTWNTGVLTFMIGSAHIIVEDINQDGKTEIITCSNNYPYVLNYTASSTYEITWFNEFIGCKKISSADVDSDGIREIFAATIDGRVIILKGINLQPIGSLTLPSGAYANDIQVADVDNDSVQEIVLARYDDTLVYNANTFNLEWQATGLGGRQVVIGNIDNDALPEIVVNGDTAARILNASLKIQEWSYTGSFGFGVGIGDVDGDNRDEIALKDNSHNVYVLDGDTQTIKWQYNNPNGGISSIYIFDTDKDNKSEVIIGQNGNVIGYQGTDGTQLWNIPGSMGSIYGIGVGDTNNDGVNEIIWGAGGSSSSQEGILVGSWVNQTVDWISTDLDGSLHVAAGDVDMDGNSEIVMASYGTNGGASGTVCVYDGKTHQTEWCDVINDRDFFVYRVKVAQLDPDPALEILLAGGFSYNNHLKTIDGSSHITEWDSNNLGGNHYSFRGLDVMNIDSDAVDEIVVGLGNNHVAVFNGASNVIEWDSGALDGEIRDLSLGDLDGNEIIDLAVLTYQSVYVIETGTWTQKLHRAVANGEKILIANSDLQGAGELLLVASNGNTLQAWDGMNYLTLWQEFLGGKDVMDLVAADLDLDGSQEFILMGLQGEAYLQSSLFWIGSQSYPLIWEIKMNRSWGIINNVAVSDLDQDGQNELLFGSSSMTQENEISMTSLVPRNFLPAIARPTPSRLVGSVTENGAAAAGVSLDLRFYNGSAWSTLATTVTSLNGSYSFNNVPSLGAGQLYYVRYQNTEYSPNRIWAWHTRTLSAYNAGSEIRIGDFDLANIALVSPADDVLIGLPYTFYWTPRSATPSDSYEFDLYDAYNLDTYFSTDPPLGYVGNFTLKGPLPGFQSYSPYFWEVWVYSPDGGYGISFESRRVYFNNAGLISNTPVQSSLTKDALDLEKKFIDK